MCTSKETQNPKLVGFKQSELGVDFNHSSWGFDNISWLGYQHQTRGFDQQNLDFVTSVSLCVIQDVRIAEW